MNEILTQLIAAAIDADKIPGLDCFDMTRRPRGQFEIVLNDTTRLRITVEEVSEANASGMWREEPGPPPSNA